MQDLERALQLVKDGEGTGGASLCDDSRVEWSGNVTRGETIDLLRCGLNEREQGTEGLDGLVSDSAPSWIIRPNVAGAFPNVPAYLAGHPESMLALMRQSTDKARKLTLVYSCGYKALVRPKQVHAYRHAVNRLVHWLSANRIACDVFAVDANYLSDGYRAYYIWHVQSADSPLQPERVSMTLHPAFMRRAWFDLLAMEYALYNLPGSASCRGGYGRAIEPRLDILKQALKDYDINSLVLLPHISSVDDPDTAIRKSINLKLGVTDQ